MTNYTNTLHTKYMLVLLVVISSIGVSDILLLAMLKLKNAFGLTTAVKRTVSPDELLVGANNVWLDVLVEYFPYEHIDVSAMSCNNEKPKALQSTIKAKRITF